MELWDIRDSAGKLTGRLHERGKPLAKGDYHLVIDAWIRNSQGEFLISHRTPWVTVDPGVWQPTCGSAVAGEDGLSAAVREVREELGIALDRDGARLLTLFSHPEGQYIIEAFLFNKDLELSELTFQPEEVDGARWATIAEVLALLRDGQFIFPGRVPYLKEGFPDGI